MQDKGKKYELFCTALDILDRGTALINAYDALLHDYGGVVLFQAESQMIKAIGSHPGITAAELTDLFEKTASACSQLIRKLKATGWVVQERNPDNSREYHLFLTDDGKTIFEKHRAFEENCYQRTFEMLASVTEEELQAYIRVQALLNKAFAMDVQESRTI